MTINNWAYKGTYPESALQGSFWGYNGVIPFASDYAPRGIITADTTEIITPGEVTLTLTSLFSFYFIWEKKVGAGDWEIIPYRHGREITDSYARRSGTEDYQYRVLCVGWIGSRYTDPITIHVYDVFTLGASVLGGTDILHEEA